MSLATRKEGPGGLYTLPVRSASGLAAPKRCGKGLFFCEEERVPKNDLHSHEKALSVSL